MIENYEQYLDFLTGKLNKFFEAQAPYIFCKRGCAKCCQEGEYPFSQIEFDYLIRGFTSLPKETRFEILNNIAQIKLAKKNSTEEKFLYQCPFLINNECSVYAYRGIICRSFGLIYTVAGEAKPKIPFCAYKGLNYSNVFEKSIESKVTAEQDALKAKNRTVQIQEEAKQKIISAEAEAKSMAIRANALTQNKALVEYEAVQKWDGHLPQYMMGNTVPFLNMSTGNFKR